MTKMTVLYAVFVALMFLVVVRRHTRSEEESGRAELLGGTAIGRDALLAAAVRRGRARRARRSACSRRVADIAGGLPVAGSLAFGASWVGDSGWSRSALTARVPASSRRAPHLRRRSPAAALGGLYVLRAVGDVGAEWLSLALAVRLVHPAAAPGPTRAGGCCCSYVGLARRPRGGRAACCGPARPRRPGWSPARPGPADGSPRLADALRADLAGAPRRCWSAGPWAWPALGLVMGAIAPERRRPARHRGGPRGHREPRRRRRACRTRCWRPCSRSSAVVVTCFAHRRDRPRRRATSTTAAPSRCWPRPPPARGRFAGRRRWSPSAGPPGCCS